MLGGYVDIQEGNTAWLRGGTEYRPTGNIAARTVWGVAAMALSPWAFIYVASIAFMRSRFATLSTTQRWAIAVAGPILVVTLIALCSVGALSEGPIVIPYPSRP